MEATDQPPPLPKWTRWIRFEQVVPEKNCFRVGLSPSLFHRRTRKLRRFLKPLQKAM